MLYSLVLGLIAYSWGTFKNSPNQESNLGSVSRWSKRDGLRVQTEELKKGKASPQREKEVRDTRRERRVDTGGVNMGTIRGARRHHSD